MKPVAIFRHSPSEGAGYLASFLSNRELTSQLISIDAGAAVPASPADFCGLVFMGGPMSVNDDLPWLPPVFHLIRQAVDAGIPVLGHCLGGQLMSKALGATVSRNPLREIGWGEVTLADDPLARQWFGTRQRFEAFHWHGETFALPVGAVPLLSSPACRNQAYAIGPHLAMQCHIEMTAAMVSTWATLGRDEIAAHPDPTVQSAEAMQIDLPQRVQALNAVAEQVYSRWVEGLRD